MDNSNYLSMCGHGIIRRISNEQDFLDEGFLV